VAVLVAVGLGLAGGGLGCSEDDVADRASSPESSGSSDGAAAPSEAPDQAGPEAMTGSYVGTVEETGAYVGIVIADDGRAVAFVTDGEWSVDWLEGFVDGEGAVLGNDGGAELKVSFAEGTTADDPSQPIVLSGTFVRPDDVAPQRFAAGAAAEPAGLYRAVQVFADGEYQGNWVVLPDGTQKGAVRRHETPLPEGAVDTELELVEPGSTEAMSVVVPGGVLHPIYVDPARL
jgi:hypothetical protein